MEVISNLGMSLDHKVKGVQDLANSATELFNNVVSKGDASADTLIDETSSAIANLKQNWHGLDAGVNIQKVIEVYNALVKVRNTLATLACDSSKVAAKYREIQIANGAQGVGHLEELHTTEKGTLEDYFDDSDTVDINPNVEQAKKDLALVVGSMDTFITNVKNKYDEIMENWQEGTGRDSARDAFQEFISKTNEYKQTLISVSDNIATSIKNYTV